MCLATSFSSKLSPLCGIEAALPNLRSRGAAVLVGSAPKALKGEHGNQKTSVKCYIQASELNNKRYYLRVHRLKLSQPFNVNMFCNCGKSQYTFMVITDVCHLPRFMAQKMFNCYRLISRKVPLTTLYEKTILNNNIYNKIIYREKYSVLITF